MKIVSLSYPQTFQKSDYPELVIALGYFDGVHLGHQAVLQKAKKIADERNLAFAIMTFEPHPSMVLQRDVKHVRLLTPLEEKMRLLETTGADYLFITEFSHDFSEISPQQFVDDYLIGIHVKHIVAGFDFTYGRYGMGKMETLSFHARNQFDFTTVEPCTLVNETDKVSSTRIRLALNTGDCSLAKKLMGRFHTIVGSVIHGEKRGRTIGFPTANIEPNEDFDLPATGVYAVKIRVSKQWYEGVCNLGYKPTFHENPAEKPTIEVHIFNFSENIYGEIIKLEWHQRIRSEKKFAGIDELVTQINIDKQTAIDYFQTLGVSQR